LRDFFEVDRRHVAVAALAALAQDGAVPVATVAAGITKYDIKSDRPNPANG
jgi:pyruvate dehydrogenase E1 component